MIHWSVVDPESWETACHRVAYQVSLVCLLCHLEERYSTWPLSLFDDSVYGKMFQRSWLWRAFRLPCFGAADAWWSQNRWSWLPKSHVAITSYYFCYFCHTLGCLVTSTAQELVLQNLQSVGSGPWLSGPASRVWSRQKLDICDRQEEVQSMNHNKVEFVPLNPLHFTYLLTSLDWILI